MQRFYGRRSTFNLPTFNPSRRSPLAATPPLLPLPVQGRSAAAPLRRRSPRPSCLAPYTCIVPEKQIKQSGLIPILDAHAPIFYHTVMRDGFDEEAACALQ